MPTLLDQRPAPRPDPVGDEIARRRAEQELLLRARQQALEADTAQAARQAQSAPLDLQAKQQAIDANRTQASELARKSANEQGAATMKRDALQWTGDKANPQYHVSWDALPEEGKQHFLDSYGENSAKAPEAYNSAFTQNGGVIPGLEHLAVSGSVTDESGNTHIQRTIPGLEKVTGSVTEKDVADAGVDPTSIPRNEWASAVAKAKAGREGKMTEMQSNALQYSARMASNNGVLSELERSGFNPATIGNSASATIAPNIMRDESVQKYVAARDNWISAVLRKESGAAISKNEYENAYKQYFPQMGDKPGVIHQKAALRRLAENNMRLVAGGRAADAETHAEGMPVESQPSANITKETYDDLPSGASYFWNGQQHQKK